MIENKLFDRVDYTESLLSRDEYDGCTFKNCNFHNSDLSHISFRDCDFDGCDFSLAKFKNTGLSDVRFNNSKLLGVQFDQCNPFLLIVRFENCLLKLAVFSKLKLAKTHFLHCNLQEADFTETDLSNSVFNNCDFQRAVFHRTKLEKADLRSSYNFSIDPVNNSIRKARFSTSGIMGLLDSFGIIVE